MATVETKKADFARYKSFVDQIDREVKKHTSITPPKIKLQPNKSEAPPVRAQFGNTTKTPSAPKVHASYKQPMPVKIKALEKAIAHHQAAKSEAPNPEGRKSWFTPASEKTRPLQRLIKQCLKEAKEQDARMLPRKTIRRANPEKQRENIRKEAEIKRSKVPKQYSHKLLQEEPGQTRVIFRDLQREIDKIRANKSSQKLCSQFKSSASREKPVPKKAQKMSNEELKNKNRAEAETLRQKVPPQYQPKTENQQPKTGAEKPQKPRDEFSSAGSPKSSKIKMSSAFNKKVYNSQSTVKECKNSCASEENDLEI